jgi:hypothetical protein
MNIICSKCETAGAEADIGRQHGERKDKRGRALPECFGIFGAPCGEYSVRASEVRGLSSGYRRDLAAWIARVNRTEWAPVRTAPIDVDTVAVGPGPQVEMFWPAGSLRLVDGGTPEADRLVAALGVRELPCAPIVLLTQRKAA